MSLSKTLAVSSMPHLAVLGGDENVNPGCEATTTWKAWASLDSGSVKRATTCSNSWNEPGQPWHRMSGMASARVER